MVAAGGVEGRTRAGLPGTSIHVVLPGGACLQTTHIDGGYIGDAIACVAAAVGGQSHTGRGRRGVQHERKSCTIG